jgi:hypothetical protein
MKHQRSCHCGRIAFAVEGEVREAIECNCAHCSRKGSLLWFVPRERLDIVKGADELAIYTFNRHRSARQCPGRDQPPLPAGC